MPQIKDSGLCIEIIHLTTGALQHWTGVIYFTFDNDTSVDTVKEAVVEVQNGCWLNRRGHTE